MQDLIITEQEGNKAVSKNTGAEFPLKAEIANEGKGGITLFAFVDGKWRRGYEFLNPQKGIMTAQFNWQSNGERCVLKCVVQPVGFLAETITERCERRVKEAKQKRDDRLSQLWNY